MTTIRTVPPRSVNPTTGATCPVCRTNSAVYFKKPDGYLLYAECVDCHNWASTSDTSVGRMVRESGWSRERVEVTLRRNYWVLQMSRADTSEIFGEGWDSTGPGTTPYNRASYEVAVCDHQLVSLGYEV